MRVMLEPIIGDSQITNFKINSDQIAKVEIIDVVQIGPKINIDENGKEITTYLDSEYTTFEIEYVDVSNIKVGKQYERPSKYIQSAINIDGEIKLEVQNFLLPDATHEELFPEWQDVEFEDFEIPEDAEIIKLEEMVIPEPEGNSTIEKLEDDNRALTLRVGELKKQMESDKRANEEITLELLELMMGLL